MTMKLHRIFSWVAASLLLGCGVAGAQAAKPIEFPLQSREFGPCGSGINVDADPLAAELFQVGTDLRELDLCGTRIGVDLDFRERSCGRFQAPTHPIGRGAGLGHVAAEVLD